jgi:DNA polymerase III subunit beta
MPVDPLDLTSPTAPLAEAAARMARLLPARLLQPTVECAVSVDADALASAVHRAEPYAGPHGRLSIQVGDGVLVVRGTDPQAGESEETVKATTRGDHVVRCDQARFLIDALRPFAGRAALIEIQSALRPTVFTGEAGGDRPDLRYVVMPMRVAVPTG